jgi:hypothetical protein
MSSQTTNYHLVKPDYSEDADIAVINGNMDTIDTTMKGLRTDLTSLQTTVNGKAATSDAVKNITRDGKTFTATRANNTTFTFDQQDTWRGIKNNLESFDTDQSLSALQGRVLNLKITTQEELYTGATDVVSGRDLTISNNTDNYIFLLFYFSGDAANSTNNRGFLLMPKYGSNNNAYYPVCVGGVNGGVRMNVSGQTINIIGASGFSHLYLQKIWGIMKRVV